MCTQYCLPGALASYVNEVQGCMLSTSALARMMRQEDDTVKESDPQSNATNDDNTAETEASADGDISGHAVQSYSAEANVDDNVTDEYAFSIPHPYAALVP